VIGKSVPDGQCGNVEATFAKFCHCSPHCQVAVLRKLETDIARESCCWCTDVPKVCHTGASNTAEARNAILNCIWRGTGSHHGGALM